MDEFLWKVCISDAKQIKNWKDTWLISAGNVLGDARLLNLVTLPSVHSFQRNFAMMESLGKDYFVACFQALSPMGMEYNIRNEKFHLLKAYSQKRLENKSAITARWIRIVCNWRKMATLLSLQGDGLFGNFRNRTLAERRVLQSKVTKPTQMLQNPLTYYWSWFSSSFTVEREVFDFLNMYMKFFYSYLFFLLMKNQELSFFFI